jgi:hypothetical protein
VNDYDCTYGYTCNGGCCNTSVDETPSCYERSDGIGGFYCIDINSGAIENQCDSNGCNSDCSCPDYVDPILIDLAGKGYLMSGTQAGVKFDILANGNPVQLSWPVAGANIGFLALDLNNNGRIDNGAELFSNISPQSGTFGQRNGFRALGSGPQSQDHFSSAIS